MLRILPREAKGRVLAALRNEGTAHDFIRDLNIKFAMAVEARYVLASLLSESGARGNVDLLPHFAVWAFNRHLLSRDSGKALQSGNQNGTGCGFGHKPVSPRPRPDLEARSIVDCQKHNLCGGCDSLDFGGGGDATHAGHIDIQQDNIRLQKRSVTIGHKKRSSKS